MNRLARRAVLLLPLAWGALGCEREPVDATPEGVVQEFLDRMQRHHGDPQAARAAYELLWSDAQRNLAERAKRASALSGRKLAPEEMIAPSRFTLRFKPKHFQSQIVGQFAVVTVLGEDPATQRHDIRCVVEDERWRVVLELPPLAPIQTRPDGGS